MTRFASNWAGIPDGTLVHKHQKQQSPDFRRGSVLEYGTGGRTDWTGIPATTAKATLTFF
ncbi:hypothetical protein [Vibrio parahaemolyticus]|uniref:hypothetical protein n=1 Tax=Vibrio parahaemolyticus TaxID=670 RepID=UPI00263CA757|nr:hypothetical protein [Vibrio parahaemolyticus]MBE3681580.1 hypothetical protein [Vibrio parahaemolyticus]MDN4733224.1 hypothetical protein [Vibrio parahaemolyticus]MDS1997150.1 hypothetical protein [Vibrio parahaemolyticus]